MNKEYINIQTNKKLDLEKVKRLAFNSMLKYRTELWIEWDFEKNDELGLDVWKITHGSGKKAWWVCKKGHKWHSVIGTRTKGCNCPYCVGQKVDINNSLAKVKPEIAKQWHHTKNGDLTPYDVTYNSGLKVWWKCSE